MSIITHKYIPEQIPESELQATFAARNDTLDYLINAIREQSDKETLTSFFITGSRGSGKTTIIRMVRLRIKQDEELNSHWLPVAFPEEQFNVGSLRDLLAFALFILAQDGIEPAAYWQSEVEKERDEEQSQQLAITGLKEVCRQQRKRLIFFVENLNQLFDSALTDETKGTLRRLLMTDPFIFIVGSAVHIFDSLRKYDEAFFNYFCPVRLDRLSDDQVFDLLCRRAEFEGNKEFLQKLPRHQSKVRAIAHLSGGNPRLILMFYELLSQKKVLTVVQQLRRLVDELTPLLKDELEGLAPQQRKIIHALMEKGGTAKPADLTGPTRLSLNIVTTQLRRLRESQLLDLRGGGKGRSAYYTAPDQLFAIWYQMRYLRQHRRRIELFVEVLRLWFEAEDRYRTIRSICSTAGGARSQDRDAVLTAEYLAASLSGTRYEELAREIVLRRWLRSGDVREAALAHAEFRRLPARGERAYESQAYSSLGTWLLEHDNPEAACRALKEAVDGSLEPHILLDYGIALGKTGRHDAASEQFDRVIHIAHDDVPLLARALYNRGVTKGQQRDLVGAIADYTAVIELPGAPAEPVAWALVARGFAKGQQGDSVGEIADYTVVVELAGAPAEEVAWALVARGYARGEQGDLTGAVADCTAAVELVGAPAEQVAWALVNRGYAKGQQRDLTGAIADYTAVVELVGAPAEQVAWALVNRGYAKEQQEDLTGAIADYMAVVELPGAPTEMRQQATCNIFELLWQAGRHDEAVRVIAKYVEPLSEKPLNEKTQLLIGLLESLALPALREAWPQALDTAMKSQPSGIVEALGFFLPVCEVLKGASPVILDALPPEQREFAQKILARFEPKV